MDSSLPFLPLLSCWQQGPESATSSLTEAKGTSRSLRNPCNYESNIKLNGAFSEEKRKRTSVVHLEKFFCQSGMLHIWHITYPSWFLDVENMEPSSAFFNTSSWLPNSKSGGTIITLLGSKASLKPRAINYCQRPINGCSSFLLFTKCLF